MSTQEMTSAAIAVMRRIVEHHKDQPDDFQIVGLPNASLTLGACRALAAISQNASCLGCALTQLEMAARIRQLDGSVGDAERYTAEQELIVSAREVAHSADA